MRCAPKPLTDHVRREPGSWIRGLYISHSVDSFLQGLWLASCSIRPCQMTFLFAEEVTLDEVLPGMLEKVEKQRWAASRELACTSGNGTRTRSPPSPIYPHPPTLLPSAWHVAGAREQRRIWLVGRMQRRLILPKPCSVLKLEPPPG
jgi:hypothetical protein